MPPVKQENKKVECPTSAPTLSAAGLLKLLGKAEELIVLVEDLALLIERHLPPIEEDGEDTEKEDSGEETETYSSGSEE